MHGHRDSFDAAEIAVTAPAVLPCVAVQQFPPESARGDADVVVVSRHRRKVADHQDRIAWVPAFSQEADNAVVGVGTINPLEPGGIEIELEER